MTKKKKTENLETRPPIVVVLGHVDHGKTTLLDYIRKTNVAAKESGGITQHIGAYQVRHNDKLITFIDTPGHEAFSQMRSRGAKVADIAILVVAAEEGVKPQTKEVISHIKEFEIPVVVAINKIDRPGANPQKVIGELAKEGIIVEAQGGKIPSVNVSAKTGQGVDELLEILLLVAEMEELKANPKKAGEGVVIEAYLNSQRGPSATFLVLDGTFKVGQWIACGNTYGKVKILENFKGEKIEEAFPSMPVIIIGLNEVPMVGERFMVVESEEIAQGLLKELPASESPHPGLPPEGLGKEIKQLNLILKADVQGSLEAIEGIIKNIQQDNLKINILKSEAGDISESDIKLAYSTGASVIGFRIKTPSLISDLAEAPESKNKNF